MSTFSDYPSGPLSGQMPVVSASDADPRLIAEVAHSTASEAEAAAKRGDTAGYLAVENMLATTNTAGSAPTSASSTATTGA